MAGEISLDGDSIGEKMPKGFCTICIGSWLSAIHRGYDILCQRLHKYMPWLLGTFGTASLALATAMFFRSPSTSGFVVAGFLFMILGLAFYGIAIQRQAILDKEKKRLADAKEQREIDKHRAMFPNVYISSEPGRADKSSSPGGGT